MLFVLRGEDDSIGLDKLEMIRMISSLLEMALKMFMRLEECCE